MVCKFILCCETAIRNAENPTISLITVLGGFIASTTAFPAILPKIVAVFFFEKNTEEPDDIPFDIILKNNEIEIGTFHQTTSFAGRPKNNFIFTVLGLPISENGKISFTIVKDEQILYSASIDITINLIEAVQ